MSGYDGLKTKSPSEGDSLLLASGQPPTKIDVSTLSEGGKENESAWDVALTVAAVNIVSPGSIDKPEMKELRDEADRQTQIDGRRADMYSWLRTSIFIIERVETILFDDLFSLTYADTETDSIASAFVDAQRFLINKDWSDAFAGATGIGTGDYVLPFPKCCFEFRVSGIDMVVMAESASVSGGRDDRFHLFIEHTGYWARVESSPSADRLFSLLKNIIRFLCISLEAEVLSAEIIHGVTTNRGKKKRSRRALHDYHVVDLANRPSSVARSTKPSHLEHGLNDKRTVRLHFRRGHWRHYADHRTWIKWMLVGSEECGTIEKIYRA